MRVFNLLGRAGQFETKPLDDKGLREFGLWSYTQPVKNDLVVFFSTRINSKVLYQLTEDAANSFKGSNGEIYWRGRMLDVIRNNNLTKEVAKLLEGVI